VLIVDLGLLAVAVAAIGAAGLRCAATLVTSAPLRVLAGASLAAGFVVAEALVLGLAGIGGSTWWLTAAALVTWLVCRAGVPTSAPRLRDQIAAAWAACGTVAGAALGAVALVGCGLFAFYLRRPTFGNDGLSYHGAQPAIWIHSGHPGSLHSTLAFIPTQAYPKTMETLLSWVYAIGRTPLGAVPLTVGLIALGGFAVVAGLRRAGVAAPVASLAAAAAFLVPLEFREFNGLYTDVPALAWLACSVALSAASRDEPAVLGPAAVAAGLAIGTKPTVAPFALVALAWGAWVNRSSLRALAGRLAAPAILALGLGAVWYVEDWASYGSPLWPFSQFPSGSPTPFIWRTYAARFLDDPVTTARAVGVHGYFLVLAGGLVLLAAVPVLVAVSLLPAGRPVRRVALIGGALVAVQAVLWADSDFTGLAHGALYLVYAGLRYLTPVFLAIAVLLALATRQRGPIRAGAIGVLVVSVALDLWELRLAVFASPLRPSVLLCIGLAVLGGVVGAALVRRAWLPRLIRAPALAVSLVMVMVVAVAIGANGYLGRYLLVAQRQNFGDEAIVRYLSTQPDWQHGHAPVAAGPEAFASLAGPHFTHPLSLVTVNESCRAIRAATGRGWVILTPRTGEEFGELDYVRPATCLAGLTPTATLPGGVRIYAPVTTAVR
jgi:hypothetical protein